MIKRELSKHSILLKNVVALIVLSFCMIIVYIQIIKQRGGFVKGRLFLMVSLMSRFTMTLLMWTYSKTNTL